ncbi:MAG: hypothetical protein AAF480_03925 [Actinomycetota bacterium]
MAITTTHFTENFDNDDTFEAFVADTMASFEGEVVSQSRAMDVLLDCYNAAASHSARELVTEYLADIQHLSAVTTDDLRDMAAMVCMAADVDSAFDHLEMHDCEFDD